MFEGLKVVYVEDDPLVRKSLSQTLSLAGFEVVACESAERALRHVVPDLKGIVVSDVRMAEMDGLALLDHVVKTNPAIPVILVTAHGDVSMAVRAMRAGAYDFIEKPFAPERLVEVVTRAMEKRALVVEVESLRRQLEHQRGIESTLLGRSPAMETLRRQVLKVAGTSADVILMGETGTGKELVARCIHDHSSRRGGHFVAINCGGLPETLLESELFGHEVGAFTSAQKKRIGKIEYANGGTLLLDEIESMPLTFQVKLLRVLQERRLERLGSNEEIALDVRVIAATKVDLKEWGAQGKFRSDLYYRLNVAMLELPALRDRREDIPVLFEHFVFQAAARHGREPEAMEPSVMRSLMAHDWPGNVRELRNAAERFMLGLGGDSLLEPATSDPLTLAQQIEQIEKALLEQALRQHRGRPMPICEALGIGRKTLYDKITRHGLVLDDYRVGGSGGGDA